MAALDAEGRRHLLVLLRSGEGELQGRESRGVCVITCELVISGHAARYLDVTCLDAARHEAFEVLGGEMAQRLVAGRGTAPVVARVLGKWR